MPGRCVDWHELYLRAEGKRGARRDILRHLMANILYGVNGEGSGHSTRAQEVISHLIAKGHVVHVASFDRGLRNLRETFDVTEIYGLRLAYVNNQVRYGRTLTRNLLSVRQRAKSIALLTERVEEWKIQLVITDFEPLTSHVGHHLRLPVISIDNQHCLTNTDVTYPRKYRSDAAVAKLVTRIMTPRADAYLVTSFFEARVKRPRTFVFPPILREQVLKSAPVTGEHVLVYVTSPAPALAKLLSSVRSPRLWPTALGVKDRVGTCFTENPAWINFWKT